MTRKEMIEEIAKEAGCSKRLVRKKLFELSAWKKNNFKNILFNKVFLSKSTDWANYSELLEESKQDITAPFPWRNSNTFEVIQVPSGIVVMFTVPEIFRDEEWDNWGECGCKLRSRRCE